MSRMHKLKAYSPPLGLMAVIFVLSSIPGKMRNPRLRFLTELDPQWQNLLHVPLFGLLQFLWLRALVRSGVPRGKAILFGCAISFGYGVFDEWHQMFVPGRYASLTDISLNLLGVVLATVIFWLWPTRKQSA